MTDILEANLVEEVGRFVAKCADLRLEQRIYHDLGITGDDAGELLNNIHRRFGTTFKEFNFHRYFGEEPDY